MCGTDLHIEAGELATAVPVTIGHELSGVVVECGPGVDSCWIGARVVSETFFSVCGVCDACRDGRPNLCPTRRSIGTHVDGAFAPRIVVPAANLHRLSERVDDHAATLAEPLACVCNALLDPVVTGPGDCVLVVGPGPIGLLAGQVAQRLGANVIVSGLESDTQRLELARSLGLGTVVAGERVDDADVVVECSGSAEGVAAALESVRPGGRYVQLALFGDRVEAPFGLVVLKELSMTSGFASTPRSWRRAIALIEDGSVALAPLVTAIAPLCEWQQVFADLRNGKHTKVVFDPRMA